MREELKLTVKLDKLHKIDLETDLEIDKTHLNDELSRQPSMYAWYATLHEMARNKVIYLKNELEVMEATLDQKLRSSWDVDSYGKMTEAGVAARVKMDAKYHTLTNTYIKAQYHQGLLNVAKLSFEQRKDMLISISANMRGETDLELKVNKEKVASQLSKMRKGQ